MSSSNTSVNHVLPQPIGETAGPEEHEGVSRSDLARIGLVGAAALFCWLRIWQPYPRLDLVGLAAVLAGGYPIYREALADIFLPPHDHGAVDDYRTRRRAGDRRSIHRAGHRQLH